MIGFHGAGSTPENILVQGNRLKHPNTLMVFPEGQINAGDGIWSWWEDGPGQEVFFDLLETPPLFDLKMRLGEGTGAVLAFSLIEAAVKIYTEMATFQSARISDRAET